MNCQWHNWGAWTAPGAPAIGRLLEMRAGIFEKYTYMFGFQILK